MRIHVALMTVVACIASPFAKGVTNTVTSSSVGTQQNSRTSLHFKATPELSPTGSSARSRIFPVSDEKGLLLTCIAPEIDKNADTDIFNDCALASGRTLDDVMHSFVRTIHYEHNQQSKEQTKGNAGSETETDQKYKQR
jgi:hypothetical protein